MSNISIVQRLESKLDDFLQHKLGKYEFSDYLINSIEALEAIDYTEIQTAKNFQYKLEIAEFNDDDPEIESLDKVATDFKIWLKTLKK